MKRFFSYVVIIRIKQKRISQFMRERVWCFICGTVFITSLADVDKLFAIFYT